jgi:hypothetical protein
MVQSCQYLAGMRNYRSMSTGRYAAFSLIVWFCFLLILIPVESAGQDSRAGQIEAAREKKVQNLKPEAVTPLERRLRYIKEAKVLERISAGVAGFRAKLGGMVTGGGFGIGPEYLREDLARGEVYFRGAAQVSTKGYQKFDLQFALPRFASDRLFLDLHSIHHNYGGINYYGPGPDSKRSGRSNYRMEDTAFDGSFGVMPLPHLKLGGGGGYLLVNTGPGSDSRFVSAEKIYNPAQAPGIDRQSDFSRYGAFAQFDYRDNPGGPRSGGNYLLRYDNYSDQTLGRHDFERLEVDLQQYFPFFNKRRVIALHGKSILTYTGRGQTVPFYLQPVLGGSDDLRGFRPFRFYDDNLLVVNAEYRWETFSGLDMAVFADGGKVFPRHAQLNFRDLEGSVGFGLRFNVRNNVFLRIDVGFSHEGYQVFFKFNNIFAGKPLGSSSPESIL